MKIVSWNCGGAVFGRGLTEEKGKGILSIQNEYNPDILVVQELNENDINKVQGFSHRCWYGDKKNDEPCGIAVFSRDKYKIQRFDDSEFNKTFRYVVPYLVTGGKETFTLFAVWSKEYYSNNPIYKIPDYYQLGERTIITGDFNAWYDGEDSLYADFERKLNKMHIYNCEKQSGGRFNPTKYYYPKNQNQEVGVIDDYCFAANDFKIKKENGFIIGKYDGWRQYSDHLPLIVNFDW
jgi:exonuclease III